jgi:hypothetical protein
MKKLGTIFILLIAVSTLSSCSLFDFFAKKKSKSSASPISGAMGQPPGGRAGTQDDAALAALYEVASAHAPAPIRPDPDNYVRQLLRQYHPEGITIAQQIARVEAYRTLLGGASEDFSVPPQLTYDATSLLASIKVAEEICTSLVAPNANDHRDWVSILPYQPSETTENVRYLAQRFIGIPSAEISESVLTALLESLELENGNVTYESYIPVCMTLAVDVEALLL